MRQMMKDLLHNLRAGFALAAFRRSRVADFHITVDQFVLLVGVGLVFDIVSGYLLSLPEPVFTAGGFPAFSLSLSLFLLAAYLFSLLLKRHETLLQTLVILSSATFIIYFPNFALEMMSRQIEQYPRWMVMSLFWVTWLWILAIFIHSAYLVSGSKKGPAFAGFCLLLFIWIFPSVRYAGDNDFWYSSVMDDAADPYSAYRAMDGEKVMYEQHELLGRALAELEPGRPGVTDLYFIGFAGYAMQDVFAKEVRYARTVMDTRFATAGRSLLFINNLRSRNTVPLATATNLKRAVQYIAGLIDKEEDVLMIYLTSHGSKKHELAVDFWPLPLNDLTPQRLRQMLDEAGIKWRIVVVSACYSGGFVEPLKDKYTLVATAADRDRKSFGCSYERDFTYFGEALFKINLMQSNTMLEAFKHVPLTISRRERDEKLKPSRPQLYLAPLMETKMGEITATTCGGKNTVTGKPKC